jgi:hypothetical protein
MICDKKPYRTRHAARRFQRSNYPDKPFHVYRCDHCHRFHITTQLRSGDPILNELAVLIQGGQSEPVESPSNRVRVHRVRHQTGTYLVSYHRIRKTAWVISREAD